MDDEFMPRDTGEEWLKVFMWEAEVERLLANIEAKAKPGNEPKYWVALREVGLRILHVLPYRRKLANANKSV
jgi:hypothetical protein